LLSPPPLQIIRANQLTLFRYTKMKYVAAYMLAQLGGNTNPQAADLETILASVGMTVDTGLIEALLKETAGKTSDSLIAEGSSKLASMPAVGSAAPAAASSSAAAAPAAAAAAKVEVKEESDEEMGMGLFD
jgi:large subunit ribosomal protein LP2